MKRNWIDSKQLRAQLDFAEVLEHYGIELRVKNEHQHQGFCPLPEHGGSGKRKSPSFSADLEGGRFHCFGCGGKGNIIDFAILMEGWSKDDKSAFRKASVKLRDTFLDGSKKTTKSARKKAGNKAPKQRLADDKSILINPVMTFSLKHLQGDHPYLDQRNFDQETTAHFGAGYCSKGMMKGRIAIPIHNLNGELVGYAGRIVDDTLIDEDTPKYLFPGERIVQGISHQFRKSELLYNAHRIVEPVKHLGIVEGFFHTWRLHQAGIPAVATMGSDLSKSQAQIIHSLVKKNGCCWLVPDPDKAGKRMTKAALPKLARERSTRLIDLPGKEDIAEFSIENIRSFFPSKAVI